MRAICCAGWRHPRVLALHSGDLPPVVDPAQPDLPDRHEAEEEGRRRSLEERYWIT
jgi:hypothetical protein